MKRALTVVVVFLTITFLPAHAQYPTKPVRLVVAFPPGGGSDTAARTVAQHMFNNGVVVDNRPGAHGVTAVRAVWTASPDGYTLLWGIGSMVALPMLWQDFPLQSMGDFQPVAMTTQLVFGMFVYPGLPVKTVADFANYARTRKEHFASAALSEELAASKFMKAAGVSMTRIGYKGGVQALPDLATGQVVVHFAPASPVLSFVRDGRVRILGVLEPERVPAFPDIPTMAEAGYPSVSVAGWQAIFAPRGTPAPVVKVLVQRAAAAVQDTTVRQQLERAVIRPRLEPPVTLAKTIDADVRMWKTFISENHIKAQ